MRKMYSIVWTNNTRWRELHDVFWLRDVMNYGLYGRFYIDIDIEVNRKRPDQQRLYTLDNDLRASRLHPFQAYDQASIERSRSRV